MQINFNLRNSSEINGKIKTRNIFHQFYGMLDPINGHFNDLCDRNYVYQRFWLVYKDRI